MGDHAITHQNMEDQLQRIAQELAERMQVEMQLFQQRLTTQMTESLLQQQQDISRRIGERIPQQEEVLPQRPLDAVNGGFIRLKVPKPKPYDGKTSIGAVENFLFDCEQYFKATLISEDSQKILFATSMLEGIAKIWWRFLLGQAEQNHEAAISTWSEFSRNLQERFQIVNSIQNARDKLANLKQIGSVRGYIAQFQNLVMQIPDINEGEQLDKFVRGLRTKTRVEV